MLIRHLARTFGAGALAGAVATIPMSVVMIASRAAGLTPELPPARITRRATEAVAGRSPTGDEGRALAGFTHIGFGMAAGGAFAVLLHRLAVRGTAASAALGLAWAGVVYLASYQGWVPALRIMPPASDDDPNRVRTMVAGHAVYGAILGPLTARLLRGRPGTR